MELFENFFEDPDKFIYEDEKQKFIEHMNFLKTMSVQESTLYKSLIIMIMKLDKKLARFIRLNLSYGNQQIY